jgi:hypothetical protein
VLHAYDAPPTKLGRVFRAASASGLMVKDAARETPPAVAVIVVLVGVVTYAAVVLKFTWLAPDGTTTVAGTVAAAVELVKVTIVPSGGAIPSSVIRLLAFVEPEITGDGTASTMIAAGLTLTFIVLITSPAIAEIVAVPVVPTAAGLMANDAEV